MDKKQFDDAIGEAPPSTVDVQAAIVRGRRAARVRAVASPTAGVAAAVVLVVGAVAFTLLPGEREGAARPAEPSATPEPVPESEWCLLEDMEPRTAEPPRAAKARLTALAADLVGARLPAGAEFSAAPNRSAEAGPLEFFQIHSPGGATNGKDNAACGIDPYAYHAYANIEVDGRFTSMRLSASVTITPLPGSCDEVPWGAVTPPCEAFTTDGGDRVLAWTEVLGKNPDTTTRNVVMVDKSDGTRVDVSADNRSDPAGPPKEPGAAQPPLTVDQLAEIALDPRLTVFP
ncbi:hypothetical protein [Actinophytocola gossypii]|uniref:Uncharacterized protein n=1 Tax=Actinophytocola gossypii TaxID=2812003 RepID=A0ABT2JBX3_9PSEU|nr:hypothetical protein [Actinophytocola gossypii]MCT2585362.1 hypothetical protein [Actinophytocola gossypii]